MVWHYVKLAWYWWFPVKDDICELSPLLSTKPKKTIKEARCDSKKERKVKRRNWKPTKPLWLED